MEITYLRDIDHCELSPYVKMVTINTVEPAENSDFLDKLTFKEMGWNAISQKGLHDAGKQVMFIPAESVIPYELSEELEVTKYLSKGRVRVVKFRGNRSEGLIVDREKVEPYLPYIMKWEDKPTVQMQGQTQSPSDVALDFCKFYKMPNILNEPDTFAIGEEIFHSEKLHGTNTRCGNLRHPQTEEYQFYVGSHNNVLKETEKNLYWRILKQYKEKMPRDVVFFGEIFGMGVQHLHYGASEPKVAFFAATKKGVYLPIPTFCQLCYENDLPHVAFHTTRYESVEQIRELADSPSECNSDIREGVVLVSIAFPDRMAKCIGFKYQTRRDGQEKRTERH